MGGLLITILMARLNGSDGERRLALRAAADRRIAEPDETKRHHQPSRGFRHSRQFLGHTTIDQLPKRLQRVCRLFSQRDRPGGAERLLS